MNKLEKGKLIDALKFFISICEENKLTYYLAAGSALGAIRHHGIIPWDDDIDIYMPRLDYEKFLSLKKSYVNEKYQVVTLEDKGYYLPYAKIVDLSTTIWEHKCFPFILGAFIDIFPLDRIDEDIRGTKKLVKKYKHKFNKYSRGISVYSFSDLKRMLITGDFLNLFRSVLKISFYRKMNRKYLVEFIRFEKQLNNNESGNYLVVFGGSYGVKEIYKREWFLDVTEVDFSGVKVKIPIGYHEYLSHLYGNNYMEMPTKENQCTCHNHYFVDYECRLTFNEIKKRKKNDLH